MKFSSRLKITIKAGNGGNGIIAWRRESRVRFGGPAGGNGGSGGSVFFIASKDVNSLYHLAHKKHHFAKSGTNGMNKSQNGVNADDLYIQVPCGTNVYCSKTNHKLSELIVDGQKYLASIGGKGGRGNVAFKSSQKSAPFMFEMGDIPVEKEVLLDLESIADVGFLGMPNAGKSTLLSQISNAQPKIAPFPFTTLIPVLGTVVHKDKKSVFADIPGLIQGASDGLGLGFEFLKHLNRCSILLHIVSCVGESPIEEINQIIDELRKYSEYLYKKPRLLIINKIDELTEDELISFKKKLKKECEIPAIYVSAKYKINIDELLDKSFELLEEFKVPPPDEPDYLEFNDDPYKNEQLKIHCENEIWYVESMKLKYWVHKIPSTTDDNTERLLNKFEELEVKKELDKLGAKEKDTVNIYGFEYTL